MNQDLNLRLLLTASGTQLSTTLNAARGHLRTFSNEASSYAGKMAQGFGKLYHQLNGFSALSKIAVAAGGYSILTDAMRRNLEFEKQLLDMKQTAQMTTQQAAEMRRIAIDKASENMALPSEIAAAMKAFSAAGMKYEKIAPSIDEAARSAVAFRATIEQMADLDFDLQDKMKLDPSQIKDAHNMLLYHAKSGRYEAAPMAMEAPKYLNSVAGVGVSGMKGLNFTAAMTQIMMKLAPKTQPNEVATFIEHGIGHITSKQQVKGLAKFGIDVKKYAPGGKFYGEGGVQGMMDLAKAMKDAGLDDPFKLDKAGFREMYTKKFWKQLMSHQKEITEAMAAGEKAALEDMVGKDKAEIMKSNYGKIRQLEITKEKAQLSEGATGAMDKVADVSAWAAENPGKAAAATVATAAAGRYAWNKATRGRSGGALDKATGALGAGTPVIVTNWPAGFGGPEKASSRMAKVLKGGGTAAAGAGTAALSGGAIVTVATLAAVPIVAGLLAKEVNASPAGHKMKVNRLDLEIAQLERRHANESRGGFGNKAVLANLEKEITSMKTARDETAKAMLAMAERPVQVVVDGQVLAETVNKANGRAAARN